MMNRRGEKNISRKDAKAQRISIHDEPLRARKNISREDAKAQRVQRIISREDAKTQRISIHDEPQWREKISLAKTQRIFK
jgi:hypothetical protein